MVECVICKKTGLKLRDTVMAMVDGNPSIVCRPCAAKKLGDQSPGVYFKHP
jgi:hypothetical protein